MALPTGQISMSQVNTELGIAPASTLIAMNDTAVRSLAGVGGSGTTISMQNLQGKSSVFSLAISSNTLNYNLATAASGAGWPGSSAIQLTINPGVVVGSTSTGAFALQIPSALNPAPSITVVNNGTVIGMGGGGGTGGNAAPGPLSGSPGAGGGNAIFVARPTTITNNGTLAGGGGGGGGGGNRFSGLLPQRRAGGGGGGGGAGTNNGAGGVRGNPGPLGGGTSGNPGTSSSGGAGGVGGNTTPGLTGGVGGSGGNLGASGTGGAPAGGSGGSGGATGNYIVGNPFVTYPATGTRLGGVG